MGRVVGVRRDTSGPGIGAVSAGLSTTYTVQPAVIGSITKSGYYIHSPCDTTFTYTESNGILRVAPLYVPKALSVDRIGVAVTGVSAANGVVRLGVYRAGADGSPGALVVDAGTIDATSATAQEITISQALTTGLYWLGAALQGAPATGPDLRALGASGGLGPGAPCHELTTVNSFGFYKSGVTGALPDPFGAPDATTGFVPRVLLRVV